MRGRGTGTPALAEAAELRRQHQVQAQAQHVKADMDQLVKLFAKSKYLAPHTPKLMRHKRVLLPHLQLLTPHCSMSRGGLQPPGLGACRPGAVTRPEGRGIVSCGWLSTPQG